MPRVVPHCVPLMTRGHSEGEGLVNKADKKAKEETPVQGLNYGGFRESECVE
jgi:hypothetical protein